MIFSRYLLVLCASTAEIPAFATHQIAQRTNAGISLFKDAHLSE